MDKMIIAAEWRQYADNDLRTAEHMATTMWPVPEYKNKPLPQAVFLA